MKTLVIYYSQTGQTKAIIDSVVEPLVEFSEIHFEELKPLEAFPFPWTGMSFFQAFPESVREIPCRLQPFSFDPKTSYNLIILAYPVWYLSPCIPMSSFLQNQDAKNLLNGKPVITISGVRNMWAMAQESVKTRIFEAGGKLIGNIVLVDPSPNLLSVITIVRWMMKGEKQGSGLYQKMFPPAGVPEKDIRGASVFGEIIAKAFREDHTENLQAELLSHGAVKASHLLLSVEKRGKMMFGFWSKYVLKKGHFNDPAREGRLRAFKYYLFAVIYLVSPIGSVVIWLFHKLTPRRTKKMLDYFSGLSLKGH